MATKHTLLATIPVGDPDLGAELEALITFAFTPGAGPTGPTYASGGEPGYPAEVEFISAEPYCNGKPSPYYGAFADLEFANLQDIARSWLESDDGYSEALEEVAEDHERAREHAAEQRADR